MSTKHRPVHHNDYVYGNLVKKFQQMMNFTDTKDVWCELEDQGVPGGGTSQTAKVVLIKRWVSRTALLAEPLLAICLNHPWINASYSFKWYKREDLLLIQKEGQKAAPIVCKSDRGESKAVWLFQDGLLVGVRLEVKAPSSDKATIVDVNFSFEPTFSLQCAPF